MAKVTCSVNNVGVVPTAEGYVGNLKPNDEVEVAALVPRSERVIAIHVDGKKNVTRKSSNNVIPVDGHLMAVYQMKVPLSETIWEGEPTCWAPYPQNHMRLLLLLSRGSAGMWEIALISQKGRFFLTMQNTIWFQCCRDGDTAVVCPELSWPQLAAFLTGELGEEEKAALPAVATFTPPADIEAGMSTFAANTGVVAWWNCAQGVGVIDTHSKEGRVKAPWSEVELRGKDRFAYLVKGERVGFSGLRSVVRKPGFVPDPNKQTFEFQAVGIRPV